MLVGELLSFVIFMVLFIWEIFMIILFILVIFCLVGFIELLFMFFLIDEMIDICGCGNKECVG